MLATLLALSAAALADHPPERFRLVDGRTLDGRYEPASETMFLLQYRASLRIPADLIRSREPLPAAALPPPDRPRGRGRLPPGAPLPAAEAERTLQARRMVAELRRTLVRARAALATAQAALDQAEAELAGLAGLRGGP